MFSGIVSAVGEVVSLRPQGGGKRLDIEATLPGEPLAVGESVAVQGACLTVASITDAGFTADLSAETERRTTLGTLARRGRVNLERALRLGDRLGGHLVQGHVDATVRVHSVRPAAPFATMRLELPATLRVEVAEKGSVAVDGVSLTVATVDDGFFEVALIPETLRATTLGERRAGDLVNLETDVLAKYVHSCLSGQRTSISELLESFRNAAD